MSINFYHLQQAKIDRFHEYVQIKNATYASVLLTRFSCLCVFDHSTNWEKNSVKWMCIQNSWNSTILCCKRWFFDVNIKQFPWSLKHCYPSLYGTCPLLHLRCNLQNEVYNNNTKVLDSSKPTVEDFLLFISLACKLFWCWATFQVDTVTPHCFTFLSCLECEKGCGMRPY